MIKEKEPDLVLQDIELLVVLSERLSPGMKGPMDGIGVGEFLSSQTKIPFINMTSHTEDSILKRAKNTGSTGFVKKPF